MKMKVSYRLQQELLVCGDMSNQPTNHYSVCKCVSVSVCGGRGWGGGATPRPGEQPPISVSAAVVREGLSVQQ
jgi:hypothetical protein